MTRVCSLLSLRWAALALALLVLSGCNDDLYAPCDLEEDDGDPLVRECAAPPVNTEGKSCSVTSLQCDTRTCARYNSSEPFCTKRCNTDADCGSVGVCKEFVFQSGERFCVETSKL